MVKGMEKTRTFFKHEIGEKIPPGFVSLTSFILKRVEDSEELSTSSSFENTSESKTNGTLRTSSGFDDDVSTIEMDIKNRPWILYSPPCSKSKAFCLESQVNMPSEASLPKGVTQGCSNLPNCVKVTSGWRPEDSRRPILEEAPTFYPTEEEFKDFLQYVSSIRPKAEHFGICHIVPPPSWQPPCIFRSKNVWKVSKFKTQIQQVDDLANLNSYRTVDSIPGDMTLKRKRISNGSSELGSNDGCSMDASHATSHDSFKSERGVELTLEDFKMYADDFKSQYFCKKGNHKDSTSLSGLYEEKQEPNVGIGNIEGEFWRIVENPSEEIEVICGANIDTRQFRSGFPVHSDILDKPGHTNYVESSWNLNNVQKLPGSLLQFVCSGICATSVPRVFMGTCLSSHCWKVEEHLLYSLSYLHLGSVKVWYGIPARYCYKFEEVVKKHFPMYSDHPEMLWKLPMIFPSVLKSEGIPVYRCIQHPKQFVITFPGAYHSGLDCGFNVMETVNFAPFDWLPFGHLSVEMYRERSRRTLISYDKLLLGAAMKAVKAQWETLLMKRELVDENVLWRSMCGKDGILTKLLKIRVRQEAGKKKFLCSSLQSEKMQNDFDSTTKRECWICLCDLHLSAVSCSLCSPGKYTCAIHAKHFCSAASDDKRFLLRYEIDELNVLISALEGDLAAIKTWGIEKLGLKTCPNTHITSNNELLPASGEAATLLDVKPIVSSESKEPIRLQRNFLPKEKSKENKTVSPTLAEVIILSDDDS